MGVTEGTRRSLYGTSQGGVPETRPARGTDLKRRGSIGVLSERVEGIQTRVYCEGGTSEGTGGVDFDVVEGVGIVKDRRKGGNTNKNP